MSALPQGFTRYKFTGELATSFGGEFKLLHPQVDLSCPPKGMEVASGIYFWVMRHGDESFRIYIGKTRNIAKRLGDYATKFAPHSPNDYKLRIFQHYLLREVPDASFALYFFAVQNPSELTDFETKAIRKYAPLLNRLKKPSSSEHKGLHDAFSTYYCSVVERTLQNAS